MSGDGIATTVVIALFLLAAAAMTRWACTGMARDMALKAALRNEGRETTAEIARLWTMKGKPMVRYAFTANGVASTGESPVPRDRVNQLRAGDPLPIRYAASNPAISHPAAWEESIPRDLFYFSFPAVAAGLVLLLVRRMHWMRRVAAEGTPAAAIVTRCSRNSKGALISEFQFRTGDGRVVRGSENIDLKVGVTICVLYLPRNPRRNHIYAESCYRVVR
jgi:hypothetical protein